MSIVQFELDRSQGELLEGHELPAGTPIESEAEAESGAECRFRTSYPVHLWPLRVESASLLPRPFLAPQTRGAELAQSVLRLTLKGISKSLPLHKLQLDKLRFYLHAGPSANVYKLYELSLEESPVCGRSALLTISPADRGHPERTLLEL